MFGRDQGQAELPNRNQGANENTAADCLRLAKEAEGAGRMEMAAHLYVAAFDAADAAPGTPDAATVDGLRHAWDIACAAKERSLAEHVHEKLAPYLSAEEAASHAERLQRLALQKLEDFGFSGDDIQEMADMIANDLPDFEGIFQLGPVGIAARHVKKRNEEDDKTKTGQAEDEAKTKAKPEKHIVPGGGRHGEDEPRLLYRDLVGFDASVAQMRERGIGLGDDAQFQELLAMLERRHGIEAAPSYETLIFRAYAREDASQFMMATAGEMDLPSVRMYMDEAPHGLPVLCVVASSDFKSRVRITRDGISAPAVLLLEDIDLWGAPFMGSDDDDYFDFPPFAQLTRGAREAVELIRSAVENPSVVVMATCSTEHQLEDFFYDLLAPVSVVDIDVPTASERNAVWREAATMFPSLRFLDRADLVRLSANMSRYDIYMASREAVEQAFRESVRKRAYVPVTMDNICDKVAAYQPLDSAEYHELEESAVKRLRASLEGMESFSGGDPEGAA